MTAISTSDPAPTQSLLSVCPKYWLDYPDRPTPKKFTLKQRIFGPMRSHTNRELGLCGRLLYGWLFTADLYYVRVDQELKEKGL